MLSHQLHKIGVSKIVQKADGRSGLAFLNNYLQNQQQYGESPPAIIILDVNMPIMDGFEFLQRFAELKTQVTWI
jgi:CheY-like chemotaxis protein